MTAGSDCRRHPRQHWSKRSHLPTRCACFFYFHVRIEFSSPNLYAFFFFSGGVRGRFFFGECGGVVSQNQPLILMLCIFVFLICKSITGKRNEMLHWYPCCASLFAKLCQNSVLCPRDDHRGRGVFADRKCKRVDEHTNTVQLFNVCYHLLRFIVTE